MTETRPFDNHGAAPKLRLTSIAVIIAVLVAITSVAACNRSATSTNAKGSSSTGPAAAVETRTYHGVGIVKKLDPKRPSIEIDHEEIKGLMPAMTMEFYVKDKSLLDGLKLGDHIAFTIEDGVGGVKITEIKKR